MCIVIDINTLHLVFTDKDTEFTPVTKWIFDGKGKVVRGGSTYLTELKKTGKYWRILGQLKIANKLVSTDDEKVDQKEKEIQDKVSAKCNDSHIIAIIAVSGCKLVCSTDSSSYPFLKQSDLYRGSKGSVPRIYSKKRNSNLLTDRNIADCCK